ncbi:hypothetical protein AnigIFM63604_006993 [Aspergillus niger]|uniref:Class I glutamine amidotransferase-like protein n=1 Tax=Aspergillus niger TaxID=5061 RepID=A0A9W6A4H8_ASPNG|nr:hypothetical protein CBS12448_4397 [Aspergillus niger]KAI2915362.1 hypothetical protein CBS147371_5918 [Aspergillus niger]KAI2930020.1 hypothetical protein CBS147320_3582 [Aspergillus niger]KAI2932187.1 hypothetical protein CBS147321_10007 [Aspergillus niger]KAI2946669.1 hypothetical protein CBS147322_7005 [Aspergillus niger]
MRTQKHLHIAVLDTDAPVPNVYYARGLYSTQFRKLLRAAAGRIAADEGRDEDIEIHTTAFDTLGGQLPSLASLSTQPTTLVTKVGEVINPLALPITGILITGSVASTYGAEYQSWVAPLLEFITTVYEQYPHVRIFGSCFGHQALADALLAGSASANEVKVGCCPYGKEAGLAQVELTEGFVDAFPCLRGKRTLRLQMIHGDWVTVESSPEKALPSPWMNIGGTKPCPIQGLYCPGRVLSYQGHFEFDSFVNRETCVDFGGRLGWPKELIEQYVTAIGDVDGNGDDSKLAAEVLVRFFAGEDDAHSKEGMGKARGEQSVGVGKLIGSLVEQLIGGNWWSSKA